MIGQNRNNTKLTMTIIIKGCGPQIIRTRKSFYSSNPIIRENPEKSEYVLIWKTKTTRSSIKSIHMVCFHIMINFFLMIEYKRFGVYNGFHHKGYISNTTHLEFVKEKNFSVRYLIEVLILIR